MPTLGCTNTPANIKNRATLSEPKWIQTSFNRRKPARTHADRTALKMSSTQRSLWKLQHVLIQILAVLEFELRSSCLPGRHFTIWPCPQLIQILKLCVFKICSFQLLKSFEHKKKSLWLNFMLQPAGQLKQLGFYPRFPSLSCHPASCFINMQVLFLPCQTVTQTQGAGAVSVVHDSLQSKGQHSHLNSANLFASQEVKQ
jgi:hypothetical protein